MLATTPWDQLQARIAPARERLLSHPIYARLTRIEALHRFMQHHVFAVWDFMSLLKALQRRFCCVEVPWLPPADGQIARLINEIVLAEETDDDGQGGYLSHFDLYRRAMRLSGAEPGPMEPFLAALSQSHSVDEALSLAQVPASVAGFVRQTFDVIASGDDCALAAAFTMGREDLLPDVFARIVARLNDQAHGGLDDFLFYLSRHIELDGEEHGPMAARLVASLCGNNPDNWQRAEQAALASLDARRRLWDGALAAF